MICEGTRETAHVFSPPSQVTESQLKKRTFHEDSDDDEVVFEKTSRSVPERSQTVAKDVKKRKNSYVVMLPPKSNGPYLYTNFTSLQINFVGQVGGNLSFRYGHEDLRHSIVRSCAFTSDKYCREHEIKLSFKPPSEWSDYWSNGIEQGGHYRFK